jgi:polysaccharide biosynthesis transport protein
MEDTHVHALDYLSILRRRKWWLTAPIVASVGVGVALVRYLPKQYKANTTIAVVAAGVSPSLVSQSAPFDNDERMRAVSQQLLSPSVLSRVAREEGLSPNPDEAMLNRLRSSVSISVPEPVAATSEPRRFDSFIVSYLDPNPSRAQRVTNRLASVFVDESSRLREHRAERTASFIATQVAASQTRLDEFEARLRHAKEAHIGQLPEQTQANLQTLGGLRQQLDTNATSLRSEQDRLTLLDRQIAAPAARASQSANGAESGSATARLTSLEAELAAARLTYTERHPEVVRLRDEVAVARQRVAAEQQRPAAERVAEVQTDPAYRQLASDRDTARMRVRELEGIDGTLRRQIDVYQARVESAPMVEQQLTSVQRDYDLEKQQYGDLSSKLRAATTAENVERDRTGEQFSVLYPATYPAEPSKPIPMRVMLLAIVGGICVGAVLMLGREYFDRSVHDPRDLREELDLSVLGKVTRIKAA